MSLRVAGVALILFAGSCAHPVEPPPRGGGSSCALSGGSAPLVSIGGGDFYEFEPLEDGSTVGLTVGAQGATMLELVVRIDGEPFECVAHETVLADDGGRELARTSQTMRPGNNPIYLVLEEPYPGSGSALHVASTVGGARAELTLFVD
jgi:hypothetical protein